MVRTQHQSQQDGGADYFNPTTEGNLLEWGQRKEVLCTPVKDL